MLAIQLRPLNPTVINDKKDAQWHIHLGKTLKKDIK